jgi:hypothetical protein
MTMISELWIELQHNVALGLWTNVTDDAVAPSGRAMICLHLPQVKQVLSGKGQIRRVWRA